MLDAPAVDIRSSLIARPLIPISAAFAVGVALGSAASGLLLTTFGAAVCVVAAVVTRRRFWQMASIFLLFATAGAWREYVWSWPGEADPSRFAGSAFVTVEGTVAGEVEVGRYDVACDLRIRRLVLPDGRTIDCDGVAAERFGRADGAPMPRFGDRIEARGRLEKPDGPRNPGGFDYAGYLQRRGIFSVFTAHRATDWRILPTETTPADWLPRLASASRASLLHTLNRLLPPAEAGVLAGIMLGARTDLPSQLGEDFSSTGTAHILATAGLHVAAVAMILLWLCRLLRIPRRAASVVTLFALALYTAMAGARPSVLRADLMATILILGMLLDREGDGPTALAATALILLTVTPGYLFDPGFQLSFATVGTIFAVMPLFDRLLSRINRMRGPFETRSTRWAASALNSIITLLALTLAAQIGSAPLTAQYFNQVSLVGLAANALIVPALVVLIAAGFASWGMSAVWFGGAKVIAVVLLSPFLAYVIGAARTCAALPVAVVFVPSPGWFLIGLYYAALAAGIWWLRERQAAQQTPALSFEAA